MIKSSIEKCIEEGTRLNSIYTIYTSIRTRFIAKLILSSLLFFGISDFPKDNFKSLSSTTNQNQRRPSTTAPAVQFFILQIRVFPILSFHRRKLRVSLRSLQSRDLGTAVGI